MRVILYTGKGGVGKTSVAAATALRCAERGYRTIVMSTDAAHSLGESFGIDLGHDPTPVAPRLWGQEIDVQHEMETHWARVQEWIVAVLSWRGMDEVVAGEMAIFPGMEELASLLNVTRCHDSGNYDVVIVDCAPTGETLRLLSFPEIIRWWMEKLFPIERKVATLLRPLVKPLMKMPFPDSQVFDSIEDLYRKIDRMHGFLTDPEKSSVRVVLNPEKMVIKEAQRSFTYLSLYGYFTDMIVCNRVLPSRAEGGFFESWKGSQEKYLQMVGEAFSPVPILNAPFFDREVVGLGMLGQLGESLFGEEDPARFFYKGCAQELKRENGHYVLALALPFLDRSDISLMRAGDELVVQAGQYKRNIFLPNALAGLEVHGARFEDNKLRILFQKSKEKETARAGC